MRALWPIKVKAAFYALAGLCLAYLMISQQATALPLTTKILDNGLTVVVIENNRAPIATQILLYPVGGMDDPIGKSGVAHVLEHMMFKNIKGPDGKELESGEFSRRIAELGGNDNAFTSQDATGYYQMVPVQGLEQAMQMEAWRMRGLDFDDAGFQKEFHTELQVVIEERRQRTENNPSAKLREQLDAAFYLNHPYRKPIIGWPGELESINLADLKAFYDQHYHPNHAVLVVAGMVKPDQVFDMAQRFYGPIPKGPPSVRPIYGKAGLDVISRLVREDDLVRLPVWQLRLPAPSLGEAIEAAQGGASQNAPTRTDAYALTLMMELIAGGAASPLYQELVVDKKLAVSFSGWHDLLMRGPGMISFYLVPPQDQPLAPAIDGLKAALHDISQKGFTQDQLDAAKTRFLDGAILAQDSLSHTARMVGLMMGLGLTAEDAATWPAPIMDITLDQVNEAARTYLNLGSGKAAYWQEGYLLPIESKDNPL